MPKDRNRLIDIIYEDDMCIVVNKPAGLAVQGGKGIDLSLDSILADSWQQRPLLVHRLDRDTSGLVLAAKTKAAAAEFSRLFKEGRIGRHYLAVCAGKPARPEGTIDIDLAIRGVAKKSETRYRLVSTFLHETELSLLELELGTGRMHQIRRHLALTGNPVIGDGKYGDFALNHTLRKTMKLRKLLLHASRLVIPETPGGKRLDISAPLPGYFGQFSLP